MKTAPAVDQIDQLIPPPWPWPLRLAVASAIIAAVGVIGWAWHFGVLRPAPDCCGSGRSDAPINVSDQPGAIVLPVSFHNSSTRPIRITDATAELPDATVLEVALIEEGSWMGDRHTPPRLVELPVTVAAYDTPFLGVVFKPDDCNVDLSDANSTWGTVELHLEVTESSWYPTFGRNYQIPAAELDDAHPLSVACDVLND